MTLPITQTRVGSMWLSEWYDFLLPLPGFPASSAETINTSFDFTVQQHSGVDPLSISAPVVTSTVLPSHLLLRFAWSQAYCPASGRRSFDIANAAAKLNTARLEHLPHLEHLGRTSDDSTFEPTFSASAGMYFSLHDPKFQPSWFAAATASAVVRQRCREEPSHRFRGGDPCLILVQLHCLPEPKRGLAQPPGVLVFSDVRTSANGNTTAVAHVDTFIDNL